MDCQYFIDKQTLQIYEEHPSVFTCDKKIAKTIVNLNRLGYVTKSSCEGHYDFCYVEEKNCPIEFLEEIQKDKTCKIKEIREDSFDYWSEVTGKTIYIAFIEKYDFKELPEGFLMSENGNLYHELYFYEKEKRRSKEDVEKEIDHYLNILEKWSEKLERKDKYE